MKFDKPLAYASMAIASGVSNAAVAFNSTTQHAAIVGCVLLTGLFGFMAFLVGDIKE